MLPSYQTPETETQHDSSTRIAINICIEHCLVFLCTKAGLVLHVSFGLMLYELCKGTSRPQSSLQGGFNVSKWGSQRVHWAPSSVSSWQIRALACAPMGLRCSSSTVRIEAGCSGTPRRRKLTQFLSYLRWRKSREKRAAQPIGTCQNRFFKTFFL
jgi:hypothetical protein